MYWVRVFEVYVVLGAIFAGHMAWTMRKAINELSASDEENKRDAAANLRGALQDAPTGVRVTLFLVFVVVWPVLPASWIYTKINRS